LCVLTLASTHWQFEDEDVQRHIWVHAYTFRQSRTTLGNAQRASNLFVYHSPSFIRVLGMGNSFYFPKLLFAV